MNPGSDINRYIYNFLDIKDLETVTLTSKGFQKEINNLYSDVLFDFRIKKIPIIQSSLHWMCSNNSKPLRYSWKKKDFTPEQKAKINIHLLDNLCDYEYPRYNAQCVIFSLHQNGLMCQLPSTSHIIREYPKDSENKEYAFIRCFIIQDYVGVLDEGNVNDESNVPPKIINKYSKTDILMSGDFNLDDLPQIKEVIDLMKKFYTEREGNIMIKNEFYYEHIDYSAYITISENIQTNQ